MGSTPRRFAIGSAGVQGDRARIDGLELHHLRDVLRMRPGDQVGLIDEQSRQYDGIIERIGADAAIIRIERIEQARGLPPLILALALIKGPRMDLAIEKAAELGASEVWPILCARCVARDPGAQRLPRWRRLAAAASKQSLSARQVRIEAPMEFGELIQRLPAGIVPVICHPGGPPLGAATRASRRGILIACGPEGDFSPEELAAAEQAGFIRASLGPNRLRTETAAIAALAIAASAMLEAG